MAGLAAFTLILPLTLVILLVMTLVVLSYREIVMVYIRPGGSYVVARENFGPRIAQVCAVALLIDYVVTVAVQIAAGTAAVASAFPAIGPYKLEICVGVVLLMCFGNLRGLKEAGRSFAVPTYLFAGSVILMIVVGLIREVLGNLHLYDPTPCTAPTRSARLGRADHGRDDLHPAARLRQRRRVADRHRGGQRRRRRVPPAGGPERPQGAGRPRARSSASWWRASAGWRTPPTPPRTAGLPDRAGPGGPDRLRHTFVGQVLFYLVQAATMLILYTGANTSFNGFPFLTSYVAGDSFLPRWLLKRGHRLVFSNAIILLTIASVALLIIKDADVNSLVPLYAIGVFTAFSMAGFGMAKYHSRHRTPGWRRRFIINFSAGVLTADRGGHLRGGEVHRGRLGGGGAVRHPGPGADPAEPRVPGRDRGARDDQRAPAAAAAALQPPHRLRLRRQLRPGHPGRAALRAELRPTPIRAVHFVIDSVRADKLRDKWTRADRGVPLDFIDVADRRLTKAAADLVEREIADPDTHVTVILPRRSYSALLGRLLHDRTADKIAAAVSRIPRSAATIVPYDVPSRVRVLAERQAAEDGRGPLGRRGPAGQVRRGRRRGQARHASGPAAGPVHRGCTAW